MQNDLLIQTIIVIEDSRFRKHHGIDLLAILRAFFINLKYKSYRQGGSTITQQLARTLYLNTKKNLRRKILEISIAFYLELTMTKDEIMAKYLSEVYMGQFKGKPIKGFEDASLYYFKKPLKGTTIGEKATLVAMLKGPNLYKPNSKAGRVRRLKVLDQMLQNDLIDLKDFYNSVWYS